MELDIAEIGVEIIIEQVIYLRTRKARSESRSSHCRSLHGCQTSLFICDRFAWKLLLQSIQNHARDRFQAALSLEKWCVHVGKYWILWFVLVCIVVCSVVRIGMHWHGVYHGMYWYVSWLLLVCIACSYALVSTNNNRVLSTDTSYVQLLVRCMYCKFVQKWYVFIVLYELLLIIIFVSICMYLCVFVCIQCVDMYGM